VYRLRQLADVPGLCHGVSTVSYGNQSLKYGEQSEVIASRRRFLEEFKRPTVCLENLICMMPFSSIDGMEIEIVSEDQRGRGAHSPKTALRREALITTDTDTFLFLAPADCPPVILYDPVRRVLALAHCSRLMSEERLLERVVGTMREEFGVDPQNIVAGIGPGIGKQSYLLEYFDQENNPIWRNFCKRYEDKVAVDLYGFNKMLLRKCGIRQENIICSRCDTAQDERFFSHIRSQRTGEREGRNAVVVGMI